MVPAAGASSVRGRDTLPSLPLVQSPRSVVLTGGTRATAADPLPGLTGAVPGSEARDGRIRCGLRRWRGISRRLLKLAPGVRDDVERRVVLARDIIALARRCVERERRA